MESLNNLLNNCTSVKRFKSWAEILNILPLSVQTDKGLREGLVKGFNEELKQTKNNF